MYAGKTRRNMKNETRWKETKTRMRCVVFATVSVCCRCHISNENARVFFFTCASLLAFPAIPQVSINFLPIHVQNAARHFNLSHTQQTHAHTQTQARWFCAGKFSRNAHTHAHFNVFARAFFFKLNILRSTPIKTQKLRKLNEKLILF